LQAFITRKLEKRAVPAGLLACSFSGAFPPCGSGFGLSETAAELTAAVSAQVFHLIPFSPGTPRQGRRTPEPAAKIKIIFNPAKPSSVGRFLAIPVLGIPFFCNK
jgi:hypothetical protein